MSDIKDQLVTRDVPSRTKELVEAGANPSIKYEIAYNTFDEATLRFLDNWTLFRVSMAIRTVGPDDVGKERLQGLHVVSVRNAAGPSSATFEGNTLKIVGDYAKGLSSVPNDSEMAAALDAGLRITYHRKLKTLKSQQLPARLKEVEEVTGGPSIDLSPDYTTLDTAAGVEFVDNVCFLRFLMALRSIKDAYGAAATHKIKRAVFRHSTKERSVTFADGVLTVTQPVDRSQAGSLSLISNDEIQIVIEDALGLKASQKRQQLEKSMVERTKELLEILGVPVEYDVEYSSFTTDTEYNFVDNVTCHRVNMALRCLDGSTKAALQKHLKRIRIRNVKDPEQKKCSVENGLSELFLQCAYEKGLSGAFSDDTIQDTLKKAVKDAAKP